MSTTKRFPPLPKTISAPGGTVTVRRVKAIKLASGHEAWGTWEPHTRTVEIDLTAPMAHQWRTLYHELAHVALDDAHPVQRHAACRLSCSFGHLVRSP